MEAQYRQKKYRDVLATIHALREIEGMEEDAELVLMEAVALYETGRAGWEERVKKVCAEYPASYIHSRLYLYLRYNRLLDTWFTEAEQAVFLWKRLIGVEDFVRGAETIKKAIIEYPYEPLLHGRINIRDMESTFRKSGLALEGAGALEKLQSGRAGRADPPVYLLHAAGRLFMAGGNLDEAENYFRRGMAGARTKAEYDRELWYMLYAVYRKSPGNVPALLVRYAETWNNPAYFADILDDSCAYLVRTGKWRELEELATEIEGYVDSLSACRFAFILSAAQKYGYPGITSEAVNPLIQPAVPPESYYAVLQGILPPEVDRIGSADTADDEQSLLEKLLLGYLTYGLYVEAAEEAEEHSEEISPAVLKKIIHRLSERGYFREAILLTRNFEKLYPREVDRTVIMSRYPRGFRDQVTAGANREGVPEHLLNGLIRVESAFDKDISSHAGAVGLTQLMPATARETAGKMGLEKISLTDPGFNIAVGARYYGDMYKRFGNYLYALFAYNAGPGRMRSWLRSFGHLPPVLFLEALPFRETRNYGRKVLVTTAYYQYLYENRPITESVELFFPNMYGDNP